MRSIGLQLFIWKKWILDGKCIESESKSDFWCLALLNSYRSAAPIRLKSLSTPNFGFWRVPWSSRLQVASSFLDVGVFQRVLDFLKVKSRRTALFVGRRET